MRLVRLAPQPSRVAEDIRAALASLGRGSTVVGGIALAGIKPFGDERVVDAFVVLPRGILMVIGVDLPDPALKLEAPLEGAWQADGWPLVGAENEVNPATRALAMAKAVAVQLAEAHPDVPTLSTVIAVGPYVEAVDQPAADLAGRTRVLHPTPTSMHAATVSLADSPRAMSVGQARSVLKTVAANTPRLPDEMLLGEGFAEHADEPTVVHVNPLIALSPTVPAAHPGKQRVSVASAPPPAPPARQEARPRTVAPPPVRPAAPVAPAAPVPQSVSSPVSPPVPPPVKRRPSLVRWLPIGAIGMLAVLLIAAILVASGGGETPPPPQASPSPTKSVAPPSSSRPIESLQFTPQDAAADQKCASHAFGDVQASLGRTSCTAVKRGSFAANIDGRQAAATVGIIEFPDAQQATDFKAVADTPGGGGILDLATETGKWTGEAPKFDGAAYASSLDGTSVRLVQVAWLPGPSKPDDPALQRAAKAALDLPINV
ncbi:hypothetical protein SAMN05421504_11652 [Amycolatopsis xylanica]|uniref:Uncharacterized protein n=1 Tax=Amycolatopsis xylanica TaxID=589385 RepID=A0A1H3SYK1_9PSEU|nr:hypothetical protein [Amycolatopsis xylanica]SDZ42767.1 hypothetical protein SAMN05421504_11652 [Amycolatopsis xylanica]